MVEQSLIDQNLSDALVAYSPGSVGADGGGGATKSQLPQRQSTPKDVSFNIQSSMLRQQ